MGALWADWKFKKIIFLEYLLLFYASMNHFLIRLWLLTKVDFTRQPAQGRAEKRSSKALPNPNLDQKRSWSLWWSVACLIHNSFLNPSKTITSEKYAQQNDEMHWKLQRLQLALVNRKGPILHDSTWMHVIQPTLQKLNELGYEVLPHLPYSPDLLPTNYHFFKHLENFLQGKCFHNQQDAKKCFQRVHRILKQRFFML